MHTPGPWHVNDDCIEAAGPEGLRDVTVAMVTGTENPLAANARLIAAAPSLLAALISVTDELGPMSQCKGTDTIVAAARDAIELATGDRFSDQPRLGE